MLCNGNKNPKAKVTYLLPLSQYVPHFNFFVIGMVANSKRLAKKIIALKKLHLNYLHCIII
jgi:hypothetical protein